MKTTKLLLGVLSILVVLTFTIGYTEEEKAYVPKDDEEIYGTWVNPDYNTETIWAKIVRSPDGTWISYGSDFTTVPQFRGTFSITDKWIDSAGNIYYKYTYFYKMGGDRQSGYVLARVSDSGKTIEQVASRADYPTELDPNHPSYTIYQREQ